MRFWIRLVESLYESDKKLANVEYSIAPGDDTPSEMMNRIRYFEPREAVRETHILAKIDGEIFGIAAVQPNPTNDEQLWIKFISVAGRFQGLGIARRLLEEVFKYAITIGRKVAPGGFTEQGERLRHLHPEFEAKYPEAAFKKDERGRYLDSRGWIVRDES